MDAELKEYLVGMEARLDAKIEKVEKALLTGFHKWASPAEARSRSHTAALRALDLEMEARAEAAVSQERDQIRGLDWVSLSKIVDGFPVVTAISGG